MIFPLRSAFIGLPLEGESKLCFQTLQDQLKEYEGILHFQDPNSPHLTLQFWPSLMEIEYDQIQSQALVLADKSNAFSLKIEGADTFGEQGNPRVLFFSVPFSEPLARLKKLCPWPTGKPFHAHITLARISHRQRFVQIKRKVIKALQDASFEMDVRLLRFYAEIDGQKQKTPLQDFPFQTN